MRKESQQSQLLELLLRLMPELRTAPRGARTDQKTAKMLYSLWSDAPSHLSNRTFRRPSSVRQADLSRMESQGLVTLAGDNIEITKIGGEVLKQMILGDERSVFEDDGKPLDYFTALANLKPTRLRKSAKKASSDERDHPLGMNWYVAYRNEKA